MRNIFTVRRMAILFTAFIALAIGGCADDKEESKELNCNFTETRSGTGKPEFWIIQPPEECNIEVKVGKSTRVKTFSPSFNNNPDQSKVDKDYGFLVRKGDPKKVLINFMGGGACWTANNCISHVTNIPYYPLMAVDIKAFSTLLLQKIQGIVDHTRDDNPFKDWTMVFIPYTTADLHWGSNDQEYTGTLYNNGAWADVDADDYIIDADRKQILKVEDGTTTGATGGTAGDPFKPVDDYTTVVKHRGFDNFLSVLRWLKINYPPDTVDQIFVTGQSAGSYGSVFNFPWVKEVYKSAQVDILGDGGSGSVPEGWIKDNLDQWNIVPNAADWIGGISEQAFTDGTLSMGSLYKSVAEYYPESTVAQYTSMYDDNQRFFYGVMKSVEDLNKYKTMVNPKNGGASADPFLSDKDSCEWVDGMLKERDVALGASTGNYYYYIGTGDYHTITTESMQTGGYPYATMVADGVKFTDWLQQMVDHSSKLRNVSCADNGGDCLRPVTGSVDKTGDPVADPAAEMAKGKLLDCSKANTGVEYSWWTYK